MVSLPPPLAIAVGGHFGRSADAKPNPKLFPPDGPVIPRGLVPIFFPTNNPYTPEKAELGWLLYFDPRLSADGTVSCASCHHPKYGYTDGKSLPTGIKNQTVPRHSPTVLNRAYSVEQFWDGRAPTLEEQAKGPIANPLEMGHTLDACVKCLQAGQRLSGTLQEGLRHGELHHRPHRPGHRHVRADRAVRQFAVRPLQGRREGRAEPQRQKGMDIFFSNKARCDSCHEGINFTAGKFTNIGIGMDKPKPDLGRFNVTKREEDKGAFKTPTLREVANTGPYMHDGSLKTLEEVVEHYSKGGIKNPWLHQDVRKLDLTDQEKKDLVEFLKALSGEGWQHIQPPPSLPQ